jgi:hypothetical protein
MTPAEHELFKDKSAERLPLSELRPDDRGHDQVREELEECNGACWVQRRICS